MTREEYVRAAARVFGMMLVGWPDLAKAELAEMDADHLLELEQLGNHIAQAAFSATLQKEEK